VHGAGVADADCVPGRNAANCLFNEPDEAEVFCDARDIGLRILKRENFFRYKGSKVFRRGGVAVILRAFVDATLQS